MTKPQEEGEAYLSGFISGLSSGDPPHGSIDGKEGFLEGRIVAMNAKPNTPMRIRRYIHEISKIYNLDDTVRASFLTKVDEICLGEKSDAV